MTSRATPDGGVRRERQSGEEIQIGDLIRSEHLHGMGIRWYPVHRVTKNFAFVRYNETAEGKFKRQVGGFGVRPAPQPKWPVTNYSAFEVKTR